MTIDRFEGWRLRARRDYHNDENPLFTRTRNGHIIATIEDYMPRDVEDNLEEIGSAYLAAWEAEAQFDTARISKS